MQQQTMTDTPQHLRRVNAALALRDVPDYPAALEQLLKAQEQAPRDIYVLITLGLTYQDMGEPGKAEEALRTALGYDPDAEPVRASLAALLYNRLQYDEVIRLLQPVIERHTSDPSIWFYYASAMLKSNSDDAFDTILQQAENAFAPGDIPNPVLTRLWEARAEKLSKWGDPDRALSIAEAGLSISRESKLLRTVKAQALLRLGQFREAMEIIEKLQAEGVRGMQSEEYLGFLSLDRIEEASGLVKRYGAEATEPSSAAHTLYWQGLLNQAAVAAEDAVAFEKFPVMTGLMMARILAEAGKSDVAREAVSRVLSGDVAPEDDDIDWYIEELGVDVSAEAILGYIDLFQDEFAGAIEHFKNAESLTEERDVEVYEAFMSVICCYQGSRVGPLPDHPWEAAPFLQTTRANLATAYCLAGDLEQALAAAKRAIEADDESAEAYKAYAVLGCVFLETGDPDKARQAWQQALALTKDEPEMEEATTLLQQWLNDL